MGDNDIRIPKGILKNKYGSSSSSSSREASDRTNQIGVGNKSYGGSSWESQLSMIGGTHGNALPVAPVPAPQHGINLPNPAIDPVLRGIKLDFPSPTSRTLHEFISSKRDLLFRSLGREEMPMSEVKGAQRNTEDHYGIVPSFDHFLKVDKAEMVRYFFQNAQEGDIVVGKVLSRSSSGLSVLLLCCEGGKHMILEDLNIRAICPTFNVIPITDPRDPSRYYDIDDHLRVEIVSISKESEKIYVGMKGSTLTPEMQHSFQLGYIPRQELPHYYLLSKKSVSDPRIRKTYQEILSESSGFQNPNSVSHLASTMGIYNNSNSLMTGIRSGYPPSEKASHLRRLQSGKWAHGHVAEGIKNFKLGKYTEAFQCLNNALNIDTENIEGLVARGALYARNGNYEKAIDDFVSALKYNPNHFNARKYLAETLVVLGKQQEGGGTLEDAIASYSKSLVILPDHQEAKEALWSLHARTEKLDTSKMAPSAAAKATELKSKLKAILQTKLGLRMDSKTTKEKKSKKDKKKRESSVSDDDSSSSSSSDDSSSDSSSSESGYKKRSKKRKKKKSKKGKKTRKESGGDRKPKELSLSPFSKRLTEPSGGLSSAGTGFSGFMDATYTELQLGISKHEKNESDEEDTKRSSRRSKDKKRSKKGKEKKKKKKRVSSESSSESDSERGKKKFKKESEEAPLQGLLPDLGDLEAKLTAYYSKIEQGKIESSLPPSRRTPSRSRSRSRSYGRDRERRRSKSRSPPAMGRSYGRERERGRSISRSPFMEKRKNSYSDVPPRVIENNPSKQEQQRNDVSGIKPWSERKPGKIDLQTDEYGNIVQTQTIVCTVKNDAPLVDSHKPSRFEMKFKPLNESAGTIKDENGTNTIASDPVSKWRPLGAAVPHTQSQAMKNAFELDRGNRSPRPVDENKTEKISSNEDRGYRRRSRSFSRSPIGRRRRSRSYSRSRSRSRSRSYHSSRSRSRSRSPSYRRDRRPYAGGGNYRGRGSGRFFRGYNNYPRGGGGRRPYGGRSYLSRDSRDRFRNRFSRTPSRSRSRSPRRSRSRSVSPRDRRRERSRSLDRVRRINIGYPNSSSLSQSQESGSSRMEADSVSQSQEDGRNEIQIGGLKTSSAADVEVLLDKRNAEKKEEMRKSNPDFFRAM